MNPAGEMATIPWFSYIALVLFIVVIISPAWAFAKVDRVLDDAKLEGLDALRIHPASRVIDVGNYRVLDREEHVLANLAKMVETNSTPAMRQIWVKKRDQYIKEIRWRKLQEVCDGRSQVH